MSKHIMQFGDDDADWCVNCGTFDIYCDDDDCEAPQTGRFDTVHNADNYLRVYCDMFGTEGLTEEGRAAYQTAKADYEADKAAAEKFKERPGYQSGMAQLEQMN